MKLLRGITLLSVFCFSTQPGFAQTLTTVAGRSQYDSRCAVCHGGDGHGGEYASSILAEVAALSDRELGTLIREGLPARGMPGYPAVTETGLLELTQFLRTLRPAGHAATVAGTATFELTDGSTVEGTPLNHGQADDIQHLAERQRVGIVAPKQLDRLLDPEVRLASDFLEDDADARLEAAAAGRVSHHVQLLVPRQRGRIRRSRP